jgi:hypothetical protein
MPLLLFGGWKLLRDTQLASLPVLPLGRLADEPDLLAMPTLTVGVFPFGPAPEILVAVFPSLHMQALALNRVGAFIEKAGLPRDRVLDDAALAQAITAAGDNFDTFYFGHDYRAADLARFFATADAGHIALRPEEQALRGLLASRGMLTPLARGAFISVPPLSAKPDIDARERATILRHELSHGLYFTDNAYAAYSASFWTSLTADQQARFRSFLGSEGYDTANEDLMRNETQAYLVHTADARFFNPASAGIDAPSLARLRARFVAGMPPNWLRARTPGAN